MSGCSRSSAYSECSTPVLKSNVKVTHRTHTHTPQTHTHAYITHKHTGKYMLTHTIAEWAHFKLTFSAAATTYMVQHWDTRRRWCAAWARTRFTAGRVGTSFGEANNGSLKLAWISTANESLIELLSDTRRRYLERVVQLRLSVARTITTIGALSFRTSQGHKTTLEECQLAHTQLATSGFKKSLEAISEYAVTVLSTCDRVCVGLDACLGVCLYVFLGAVCNVY